MINTFRSFVYFLCLLSLSVSTAQAEDEESTAPKAIYHALKPSFVANFGETIASRLKFIKADVSIMAYSEEAITAVMDHNSLIRHQVVMSLSAQSEESLASTQGQEALRLALLEKVKAALKEETGKEQIDDLLFTSFVVQR